MEHIFFNMETDLAVTAPEIFNAIGVGKNILEGDSLNVLGGIYYECQIFGCSIRLEQNSYDWEDEYKYMVTVKKDVMSDIATTEESIRLLSHIVANLLHRNLGVEVAIEIGDKLEVFHSK